MTPEEVWLENKVKSFAEASNLELKRNFYNQFFEEGDDLKFVIEEDDTKIDNNLNELVEVILKGEIWKQ